MSGSGREENPLKLREQYVPKAIALVHPITVVRGNNEFLEDDKGNRYIDLTSGIGTTSLGHANRELVEEAEKALRSLWHTCIMVANYKPYVELAQKLAERIKIPGSRKVMLFNSGSEAVENAAKSARAYTRRPYIVSFIGAFHGRTNLSLALTGKYRPYKPGYEPLPSHVVHAPYPYCYRLGFDDEEECSQRVLDIIELILDVQLNPDAVASIIIEPIQGEGGFVVPPKRFMDALGRMARDRGVPLIVDEIQTGYCRTGRFMAFENFGIEPDIVTLGKAIANGLPLSAVVARSEILDSLEKGGMGGTYGGNPVAASVALKVLEIFDRDNLCYRAQKLGSILAKRLEELHDRFDAVGDHRGLGVMRAIELVKDRRTREPDKESAMKIIDEARRRGVILMKAGYYDNVIRFHPPLTIGIENLEKALDLVEEAMKKVLR